MKLGKMIGACALTAVVCTSVTAVAMRQDGEPSMEEMMEKWAEMTAPDEHHEHMKKMAGTWQVDMKMWMYPGADAMESTAVSTMESILDGRYILEHMDGEMDWGTGPMPFHGMNLIGYDTFKKKWVYCWVDNNTTGLMMGEGTESADGKTVTYWSEGPDPMTGNMKKMKSTMTHINDNEVLFRMYDKTPDGHEFVTMEGAYTRKH